MGLARPAQIGAKARSQIQSITVKSGEGASSWVGGRGHTHSLGTKKRSLPCTPQPQGHTVLTLKLTKEVQGGTRRGQPSTYPPRQPPDVQESTVL
ncbi:hypothetical protein GCM10007301_00120 [Azorhizobium oxalatiphilum]|uniref:Uncharacterized protein n=1 Tax=Azorhizobium oxalatiphilum TaxID=980631 RepID=A0A917BJA1_9HYPH|nr:hypothetical protein GCM10007301_00120 [Azorhizobium oxalatiphilum]